MAFILTPYALRDSKSQLQSAGGVQCGERCHHICWQSILDAMQRHDQVILKAVVVPLKVVVGYELPDPIPQHILAKKDGMFSGSPEAR